MLTTRARIAVARLNVATAEREERRVKHEAEIVRVRLEQNRAKLKELEHLELTELLENTSDDFEPYFDGVRMKRFVITFPAHFRPQDGARATTYPEWISGRGYLLVSAPSKEHAVALAWVHFGAREWSSCHPVQPYGDLKDYPAGAIGHMDAYGWIEWFESARWML